jgi:hypothetical protein
MVAFSPPAKNIGMVPMGLILLLGLFSVLSHRGGPFFPLDVSFSNDVSLSNSTSAVR